MEPKGKKLLKVCGIIMIVFGAIGLITSLLAFAGVAVLVLAGASAAMLWTGAILALVGSIAELICGIICTKNSGVVEKAGTCKTWGIIVAVICVLGQVLSGIATASVSSFPVGSFCFGLVWGLVLPVLVIIGAKKNSEN